LAIKSQHNLSVACYDDFVGLVHELLPPNSRIPKISIVPKKLLEGLGMPYHKIDVCEKKVACYTTKITRIRISVTYAVPPAIRMEQTRFRVKCCATTFPL
jgi:hypothetical protein